MARHADLRQRPALRPSGVGLLATAGGLAAGAALVRARRRIALDRRRFALLAAVAEISDHDTTIDEALRRLGDLLVPDVADICVIDVVRDGGEVERLSVVASGPRAPEIEAGLRRRAEHKPGGAPLAGAMSDAALQSREGRLITPDDEIIRSAARGEEDLAFLRSLDVRSAMILPLRGRGRGIGSLALIVTAASGRRYDEDELAFAKVLSGRVALALDNAGLFSEVEALAAQQSAALGSLAAAVTVQDARGELVYANDAAARSLGFASAEQLLATPRQAIIDAFESFDEEGRPLRLEDVPGRRALAGETPRPMLVRAIHRATGEERWRLTKATAVLDRDGRPRMAVNIIEDVTEVKRAELAQRFLAGVGELLASSLDYEETLGAVARLAVPELADWCGVSIADERGYIRSVAVAHVDPDKLRFAREYNERYPARVDDETGVAQVLRDGLSQIFNEIPDELLAEAVPDPDQLAALRSVGMRAVMIVPMAAPSGVLGAMTFVSAESGRTFSDADRALAEELGRRAGTAIENARLYTERSRIASTLQASLLPDDLPEIPGFRLAALYRPAGEQNSVGGDFYDVFPTASGWMLVIGDVTGRGAHAAALTAQARHTLRTAATLLGDPVAAVAELNRALASKPDISICTVAIVHVAERDGRTTATLLCAGHPQPFLVRDPEARQVGRTGPVVGAWDASRWTPEELELLPGDVLVLYTDGVIDARGAQGRFGEDRLAVAVRGAGGAEDAVQRVLAAVRDFEDGAQADDTAIVAMERLATPAAIPVADAGAGAVTTIAPA